MYICICVYIIYTDCSSVYWPPHILRPRATPPSANTHSNTNTTTTNNNNNYPV